MARNVVAPAACICWTMGSTLAAKASAASRFAAVPLAWASGRLVRFPRTAPCAFFWASAALVRSAISVRSFCARVLWVWVAIASLLVSGYWMLFVTFGGFAKVGVHVHIMQTIGWLMIVLFGVLFYGQWPTFTRAVDDENWPAAGASLNTIRQIIAINLPLGLIVVVIVASGRYWG